MSNTTFNTLLSEVDNFSYEQCTALLARLSKVFINKNPLHQSLSPIECFFGTVDKDDSDKMLATVEE